MFFTLVLVFLLVLVVLLLMLVLMLGASAGWWYWCWYKSCCCCYCICWCYCCGCGVWRRKKKGRKSRCLLEYMEKVSVWLLRPWGHPQSPHCFDLARAASSPFPVEFSVWDVAVTGGLVRREVDWMRERERKSRRKEAKEETGVL